MKNLNRVKASFPESSKLLSTIIQAKHRAPDVFVNVYAASFSLVTAVEKIAVSELRQRKVIVTLSLASLWLGDEKHKTTPSKESTCFRE